MIKPSKLCRSESGNALLYVLIGIALFAALMFTFSRSGSEGTSNISKQEVKIAASDLISYSESIEKAVNRLRLNGVSESDIDFQNDIVSGYTNANCADGTCEIFDIAGGQQIWQTPQSKSNDGSAWAITGAMRVNGVGTDGAAASNAELVMVAPNVNKSVCVEINNRLGITNPSGDPPQTSGDADPSTKFVGTYAAGDQIAHANLNSHAAGCFEGNGTPAASTYHFYRVLLAR